MYHVIVMRKVHYYNSTRSSISSNLNAVDVKVSANSYYSNVKMVLTSCHLFPILKSYDLVKMWGR